jgi:ADP-ribose pyrophosphatase
MDLLLKCRKFDVCRIPVPTRDGLDRQYEIIVHPGAVVMLPLLSANECILIRNFRRAVSRELWELPAGTLDVPGEPPEQAAARELEEEIGYRPATLTPLCEFYTSPGILTELIRAYVATGLTKTRQNLGATEEIMVETVKVSEALAMVRDGRIVDAKTIATLLRWNLEQGREQQDTR